MATIGQTMAKEQFDKTIHRCKSQVTLYNNLKKAHDNGELPSIDVSQDILRGAIVLAVAALDAYATDCFTEKFITYIKQYSVDDSLAKLLSDAGFDVKFSLELIKQRTMQQGTRPFRKIKTLISQYYSKHTTQRLDAIDDLFLQYRLKGITKNAAQKSGKKRLLRSVEELVARRHEIVHCGDYNDHRNIRNVKESDIKRIDDLQMLVDNIESIVQNRFK